MSKYTIQDVIHLFPEALTGTQIKGLEDYLNNGTIPPADPCIPCEPNVIRAYIARIKQSGVESTLGNAQTVASTVVVEEPEVLAEPTIDFVEEESLGDEEETY